MTALVGPLNHPFWWPWVPAMALSVEGETKAQKQTPGRPVGTEAATGCTR